MQYVLQMRTHGFLVGAGVRGCAGAYKHRATDPLTWKFQFKYQQEFYYVFTTEKASKSWEACYSIHLKSSSSRLSIFDKWHQPKAKITKPTFDFERSTQGFLVAIGYFALAKILQNETWLKSSLSSYLYLTWSKTAWKAIEVRALK